MKKVYKCISEDLVQTLNELYHDLVNENYHYNHPEIFLFELERWKKIFSKFFSFKKKVIILDIGTGTGFVPLTIAHILRNNDKFICCDISSKILEVAKKKLAKHEFKCQFEFKKLDKVIPFRLPFKSSSIDIITLNSVLHHIKNTEFFLHELLRILKTGGFIFIGHEPNSYFYSNKILKLINYLFQNYYPPIRILSKIYSMLRINSHQENSKKKYQSIYISIIKNLNDVLIKNKIIKNPLSIEDVIKIVDIKSREGFKPDMLFPHNKLLYIETYNHLGKCSTKYSKKIIVKKFDKLLKRLFPTSGATFFLVTKKLVK